jgi:protein SCO1
MTLKRVILPAVLTFIAIGLFFFFQNINNKVFVVEGQIIGFSENENRIFINHEEIPGYMDAMSMPFNLRNMQEVSEFSIGDAIRFEFHVTPDGSWIQNLTKIPDSLLTLSATPSRFGRISGGEISMPLKAGESIPEFEMLDQNGRPFSSDSLSGYFTVLTFIYTTCPVPDFCPLMSSNLDKVSELLTGQELDKVKLVSVTFDPENDTPEVLKAYAGTHSQRGYRYYLVGDSTNTAKLTSAFGIFTTFATDQIIHNLQTAIIGPDGEIKALFSGNRWAVDELVTKLREQLNSDAS